MRPRRERDSSLSNNGSTQVVAGCLGLTGFAVAVIAGIAASNPLDVILTRALLGMIVATIIGAVIGHVAGYAVSTTIAKITSGARLGTDAATGPVASTAPNRQKQPTS